MGKLLSEVDRAYLAGLIDGDGAIMASIEPHPEKRFRFRVRVAVHITQLHERDVAWLPGLVEIGRLRVNRTTHQWVVQDQQDILWLMEQIAPYSRLKTNQIQLAKEILNRPIRSFEDLLQVARLADTLASFNVRSRNRRKNFVSMIEGSSSRND